MVHFCSQSKVIRFDHNHRSNTDVKWNWNENRWKKTSYLTIAVLFLQMSDGMDWDIEKEWIFLLISTPILIIILSFHCLGLGQIKWMKKNWTANICNRNVMKIKKIEMVSFLVLCFINDPYFQCRIIAIYAKHTRKLEWNHTKNLFWKTLWSQMVHVMETSAWLDRIVRGKKLFQVPNWLR